VFYFFVFLKMIYVNDDVKFGSWSWDILTSQVTFSPSWFTTLGYPVPKNLNQNIETWESLIHPDDKDHVMQSVKKNLDGNTFFYQSVNRLLMKSGEYRENLDVGLVIVRNASGNPLKMTGVDIDLSKTNISRKEIENNFNQYKLNKLTKKEIEICEFLKTGHRRSEIAEFLGISSNTVKTHEQNIFKKFKLSSRNKLMSTLFKNDLVEIILP
jgi:DNA-binding NarL/FixJ family response regulator